MSSPTGHTLSALEQRLVDIIKQGKLKIPSYPAVVAQLGRLLGRHDYTMSEVTALVNKDQALAATLLRVANSAHAGAVVPINSIERSVMQIGSRELLSIATAATMGKDALRDGPLVSLRRRVWTEAVIAALVCRELAVIRRLAPEEAFLCGLLHDFGKVVVLAALERLMETEPAAAPLAEEAWMKVVERLHVAVGALVGSTWRLPPKIVAAITCHHGSPPDLDAAAMVDLVMVADAVNERLRRLGRITADDLAPVAAIAPSEREIIVRLLPGIAEGVVSLAPSTPQPARAVASRVASPKPEPGAQAGFTVVLERIGQPIEYLAQSICPRSLVMLGPTGLSDNTLVKVSLHVGAVPLKLWMTVVSSAAQPGGHVVELKPFAFTAEQSAQFDRLIREANDESGAEAVCC